MLKAFLWVVIAVLAAVIVWLLVYGGYGSEPVHIAAMPTPTLQEPHLSDAASGVGGAKEPATQQSSPSCPQEPSKKDATAHEPTEDRSPYVDTTSLVYSRSGPDAPAQEKPEERMTAKEWQAYQKQKRQERLDQTQKAGGIRVYHMAREIRETAEKKDILLGGHKARKEEE